MKTQRLIQLLLTGLILLFVYTAKAQPTWNVDAHQYMYSMTITGKVFANGTFSTDINDRVGAFVNDECRGVANVKYIPSVDSYFVFLMVYSNSPTENVTFRLFDHSMNLETSVKETAIFSVNGNLGSSLNPFIFTASNLNNLAEIKSFSIPFQQGPTSIVGNAITLKEDWRGNLQGIAPGFTLSSGAKAFINGVEQFSGMTVNDFDTPVQYTVQSEDHKVNSVYTVTITTANDLPTDILLSRATIGENAGPAWIGNLSTVTADPDETHVYSLVDGNSTANQYFKIIGNQLFSLISFNYESNSSYLIKVKADDQKGGVVEKYFTITVIDQNEAPTGIHLTNVVTPVLAGADFKIANFQTTDPDLGDSHTYSLEPGNGTNDKNNGLFKIVGNQLKSKVDINFRKGDQYDFLVKAVDGAGASVVVPLSVQTLGEGDLSSQSELLAFSINQQVGETVISGNHVYVKQHFSGNLGLTIASFTISPGALAYVNLVVQTSGISVNNLTSLTSFVVEAADKTTTTYILHATVANDIPTDILLSNTTVDENLSSTTVGEFSTVTENPKEVHTYSLVNEPGNDNAYFKIEASDLRTAMSLNFEYKSRYLVKVRADDQKGGTVDQSFTIRVNDLNEAPINIKLADVYTPLLATADVEIATLLAIDPEAGDIHTFHLEPGNGTNDKDNGLFKIAGNQLISKVAINFRKGDTYHFLVKTVDRAGASVVVPLTIQTQDEGNLSNHSELLSYSINQQVGETVISGTHVYVQQHYTGNLGSAIASFTIPAGAFAYVNSIRQTSGITVNNLSNLTSLVVEAADKTTTTYSIHATVANDIPTDILLSNATVDENLSFATVGQLTTVTENPQEVHLYSLVNEPGTDNAFFKMNGSDLKTAMKLDFEFKSSYLVKVRADDQKGGTVDKSFTIRVNDLNEAPTAIRLIHLTTPILAAADLEIATLEATDPDAGDSHTFGLEPGNGTNDQDNGLFKIVGNQLKSKLAINFRKGDSYHLLVKTVDRAGASVVVPLTLQTQDEGNLSHLSQLLTYSINQQVGETVISGTHVYVQQHFTGNLGLTVASFTIPAGAFAYVNSVRQTSGITVNNLSNLTSLVVEAADKTTTTYILHATVANDMPTDILLSNTSVDENVSSTLVGNLTTVTENPHEVHVYSLVPEPGNDIAYFTIEGSNLKTAVNLDYEHKSSYLVKVRADDQKGGTVDKSFTIRVNDLNEAPTAIYLSNQSLRIGMDANEVIGELTAQDPDALDTHVFSLVTGNGVNDDGNELVKISGNRLLLTRPVNYLVKMNWNLFIKVTDQRNGHFEKSITLSMSAQGVNHLPVFASKPMSYVMQDELYVYLIDVTDLDNDPVTYRFENLPGWLKYYPELGLLTGSPDNSEVGAYSFNVIANDLKESAVQKVNLMVLNINDTPEINYILDNQLFIANADNQFVIPMDCFVDPDQSDLLTYSVSMGNNTAIPSWLSIDCTNGIVKGNPPLQALGTYPIKLTATDQKKAKEWMIFYLDVTSPTAVGTFKTTDVFQVYPNPVIDFLNLKFSESQKNATLNVLDEKGGLIRKIQFEGNFQQIYLGDLPSGVYFVSLLNDRSSVIRKIIKN